MLDHGIPVALGTDEAICDDTVNMWTVAKTAGLIHNISGARQRRMADARRDSRRPVARAAPAPRPRATTSGRSRPGMLADLALVDLHAIAFTPLNDLREQLVHCEDGRDVVLTMVAGGRSSPNTATSPVVDEAALLDEAREVFAAKAPAHRAPPAPVPSTLFPAYQHIVRRAAATDVGFSRWLTRLTDP